MPLKIDYAYTVPELKAKDSLFTNKLYKLLAESSKNEHELFSELIYFNVEINTDSEYIIGIEAAEAPFPHTPIGYFQHCNKFFILNGDGTMNLFDKQTNEHYFHGDIPVDFDDRCLFWMLKYKNGNLELIEYPDKHH